MMCAPGPISGATARLIFTQTHDTVPSDRDCRPARCIAKALVKRGKAGDALATSDPVSDERVVRSVVLSAALISDTKCEVTDGTEQKIESNGTEYMEP